MKRLNTFLFILIVSNLIAQVTGTVLDEKGEKLPFVNIYLENSIIGTTSNDIGYYSLEISKPGTYVINYQFLGFKEVKKTIRIDKLPFIVAVTRMQPQDITLKAVTISSKENPAVQIIRNAISSRGENTKHLEFYTADFYSKGLMRVINAPKKMLGQEIKFPFPLDSTRSGIIYLSETISKITSQKKPKKFKELIIASKRSGEDNGISFNSAKEVNFNLYINESDFNGTKIISPISSYALQYYDYKFTGTFYDSNGFMINKIKLIPKQKNSRTYEGFLYIVEDTWAIYGVELNLTGKRLSSPMVKKLKFKQDFKYSPKLKKWNLLLQTIDFKAGIFGLNFNGRFSASYSNYKFQDKFEKKTFTNEILSFSKNATKKDTLYWKKIRPIELTIEELKDYTVKDSIKTIIKSKKYLDSVDVKGNKFKLSKLLFGYNYRNSYEKYTYGFTSPLLNTHFNTVQGFNTKIGAYYSKRLNDNGKYFKVQTEVNYGFSDKKWRPLLGFKMKWDYIDNPIFNLYGGASVVQFDRKKPISILYNDLYSTLFRKNYMKLYEKNFILASYQKDVSNGVKLKTSLEYTRRNPLVNTSSFSFFNKDKGYSSNNPTDSNNETTCFQSHNIIIGTIGAKITFANKYMTYPNRRINYGNSKYPELFVNYRKTFGASNKKLNADLFTASLHQKIDLSGFGDFKYKIVGSKFLKKKNIAFMDYIHPTANKIHVVSNTLDQFNILDYYKFSTNDSQASLFAEHNFKGFILNKIPLLNKLNFHVITGVKSLYTPNTKPYNEFSVGLGNLGFGKWRLLRVDYVRSFHGNIATNGFVVGLKF